MSAYPLAPLPGRPLTESLRPPSGLGGAGLLGRAARLVLASASPRRQRILDALRIAYRAFETEIDEGPKPGESPESLARRLAAAKARAGALHSPSAIALGADTVVALGRRLLGKPRSSHDAFEMLRRLRGRTHRVVTAVASARAEASGAVTLWERCSVARVGMRPYTDQEIEAYVASGDSWDKAGGYAIQHPAFRPVERLEGCFLTVVGLPLPECFEVLAWAGLRLPEVDPATLEALCPGCRDRDRLPISTA